MVCHKKCSHRYFIQARENIYAFWYDRLWVLWVHDDNDHLIIDEYALWFSFLIGYNMHSLFWLAAICNGDSLFLLATKYRNGDSLFWWATICNSDSLFWLTTICNSDCLFWLATICNINITDSEMVYRS